MAFDIFARDHASRVFDKVGDNAERLGRRIEGAGSSTGGLSANLRNLDGAANDADGSLARVGGQMAKLFGSAGALAGKAAAAAGALATVGAAAASAAGYTVALAASIAPLSGLLAGLPGVALTGAAAFTTWKLATGGLSEAMGAAMSGNAEALAAALGKLSDGGRAFITEFEQVIPQFRAFKAAAQDAFTEQLSGQMQPFIAGISGLKFSLGEVAAAFGGMTRKVLEFASASSTVDQLDQVLRNTRQLLDGIWGALQPLLQGFTDLGVVGSTWLAGFSGNLENVLTRFGEWMTKIAESGKALEWLNEATAVLKQLGSLAKNLWDILTGLLKAAESAGTGALGVLSNLVEKFDAWVNSTKGQDTLITIFKALDGVGRALVPVIEALVGAISAIAPVVARIAVVVGSVLTEAITALGPALAVIGNGVRVAIQGIGQAVSALAPALLPLGQAIGSAFATLKPLFAAIGEAVAALLPGVQKFFLSFASGLLQLAPTLAPLGAALGGIFAALAPLLPLVGQLAALFVTSLASGIQAILPSLQLLVANIGQALLNLAPIVPLFFEFAAAILNALVPALAPLLPQIAALITQLVSGLVPALTPLIPIIGQIVGIIGQTFVSVLGVLVARVIEILPPLSQMAQILGLALLDALQKIAPHLPALVSALLEWLPAMVNLLPSLTSLAVSLLPRFFDSLDKILPLLPGLIEGMIHLNQVMYPMIPIIADLLTQLAPYIPLFIELAAVIAVQLIPPLIRFLEVVTKTVGGVIKQFSDLYDRLVGHSIIPDLITKIDEWVGKLPGMFSKWVGEAKDWAIRKFQELASWVSGLPGQIVGALGNMGGLLGGAGHDLIIGFWNGMVGMFEWLKSSIYNFFSAIMPDWVKDALGIHSPSRVFAAIGRQIPAGMALGIDRASGLVESAVQGLAGMATVAATAQVGVSAVGGGASMPITPRASSPTFVFNFAGQPLVGRDEISRLVIAALNEARGRGFNLGAVGA
ncbi:hypothetical protein [Nonomuraea sp. NPDC049400]|uniref:hypothetical protein n=1 Tax=Nonomuraea sp. NPDC049400 TaxID=3364352 RepID=UPI00378E8BD7